MNSMGKPTRALIAIGAAVIVQLLVSALYHYAEADALQRIAILLGGNIAGGGYIQFLTFFAFFLGTDRGTARTVLGRLRAKIPVG